MKCYRCKEGKTTLKSPNDEEYHIEKVISSMPFDLAGYL
jgi:hypothetical protein